MHGCRSAGSAPRILYTQWVTLPPRGLHSHSAGAPGSSVGPASPGSASPPLSSLRPRTVTVCGTMTRKPCGLQDRVGSNSRLAVKATQIKRAGSGFRSAGVEPMLLHAGGTPDGHRACRYARRARGRRSRRCDSRSPRSSWCCSRIFARTFPHRWRLVPTLVAAQSCSRVPRGSERKCGIG